MTEKLNVRVEGAFDHYPQNQHILANAVRSLGNRIFLAACVLAGGIVAAALIVAGAVS